MRRRLSGSWPRWRWTRCRATGHARPPWRRWCWARSCTGGPSTLCAAWPTSRSPRAGSAALRRMWMEAVSRGRRGRMFDDFVTDRIDVGQAELFVRHGGSGPPVLLLHGHPRTHATWHRVAPLLAPDHTVVCPDLRGYGRSSKPPTTPEHEPYSKRAMGRDCVEVMRALGHERFAVAGHDRGSYVAFRLAMDNQDRVS